MHILFFQFPERANLPIGSVAAAQIGSFRADLRPEDSLVAKHIAKSFATEEMHKLLEPPLDMRELSIEWHHTQNALIPLAWPLSRDGTVIAVTPAHTPAGPSSTPDTAAHLEQAVLAFTKRAAEALGLRLSAALPDIFIPSPHQESATARGALRLYDKAAFLAACLQSTTAASEAALLNRRLDEPCDASPKPQIRI